MTEEITITDETPKPLKLAKSTFSFFGNTGSSDQWSPDDVDKLEVYDIKKYHKVVELCRFFYRKDPIAGTVVNKMVEIGITNLIFDKGKLSENELRIFESIKDELQDFAENCALEYLISGLVIPEINYTAVGKDIVNELSVKKYSSLTLPTSMWLRDPTTIKIQDIMVLDKPSYYVILPEQLIQFIMSKGVYPDGNADKKLYNELVILYPEFIELVRSGKREILLENDLIVRRRPLSDNPYPTPYLYNALEAMKHKRNLRRMDYSIASRVISAIQLIQLGSDEFPVTEDDEEAFSDIKDQMAWRNTSGRDTDRIFQLFANHTLKITWVFPDIKVLVDDAKYKDVNQDIFFGLGFPRILTTGETERTQTSDPELATVSPSETMTNMQEKILKIIKGIVKEVSILNGLKYIPGTRFEKINLNTLRTFVESMKALYETGNISRTTFDEMFGFNWREESEKRAEENKLMKELEIGEFAPQPFSPQPNPPNNQNNNQNNNNQPSKE